MEPNMPYAALMPYQSIICKACTRPCIAGFNLIFFPHRLQIRTNRVFARAPAQAIRHHACMMHGRRPDGPCCLPIPSEPCDAGLHACTADDRAAPFMSTRVTSPPSGSGLGGRRWSRPPARGASQVDPCITQGKCNDQRERDPSMHIHQSRLRNQWRARLHFSCTLHRLSQSLNGESSSIFAWKAYIFPRNPFCLLLNHL